MQIARSILWVYIFRVYVECLIVGLKLSRTINTLVVIDDDLRSNGRQDVWKIEFGSRQIMMYAYRFLIIYFARRVHLLHCFIVFY